MRLRVAIALVLAALGSAFTAAWAHAAFPGENGKIALASDRDGDFEIYTVNPDNTGLTQLTFDAAQDRWPVWSPDGTRIAFSRGSSFTPGTLWTMNADGSNQQSIGVSGGDASWSPDGTKIVTDTDWGGGLFVQNADGSNRVQLTSSADSGPAWSPDGTRILFSRPDFDIFGAHDKIWAINPDGTGETQMTHDFGGGEGWHEDTEATWAPYRPATAPGWWTSSQRYAIARKDATDRSGGLMLEALAPGSSQGTFLSFDDPFSPAWSPDGMEIVYSSFDEALYVLDLASGGATPLATSPGEDTDPDWQPIPVGYPRPRSASPLYLSLVPYSQRCTTPNREHGPPLAHPSCAPPAPGSNNLTVGVGDGHPALSRSTGFVRFKALVGDPGGVDDSDVRLRLHLTNVMWASDLSEYAGELLVRHDLRITDRFNTPDPAGSGPGTVTNLSSSFKAQCTPTAAELEKSVCDVLTSMDALTPGAIPEGKRTVWQVGPVVVFDGGPDGDVDTHPNRPFATQGIFVP